MKKINIILSIIVLFAVQHIAIANTVIVLSAEDIKKLPKIEVTYAKNKIIVNKI